MFDPAIPRREPVADPAEVAALMALMPLVLTLVTDMIEKQVPGGAIAMLDVISTECQVQLLTSTGPATIRAEGVEKCRLKAAHRVKVMIEQIRQKYED